MGTPVVMTAGMKGAKLFASTMASILSGSCGHNAGCIQRLLHVSAIDFGQPRVGGHQFRIGLGHQRFLGQGIGDGHAGQERQTGENGLLFFVAARQERRRDGDVEAGRIGGQRHAVAIDNDTARGVGGQRSELVFRRQRLQLFPFGLLQPEDAIEKQREQHGNDNAHEGHARAQAGDLVNLGFVFCFVGWFPPHA